MGVVELEPMLLFPAAELRERKDPLVGVEAPLM